MAHVVHGKIEIDVGIKSPADKFHDVFNCRPHHVSNMSPAKVQGCKLHRGQWGAVGSVTYWNYVHDGEAKAAKCIIEAIDNKKNSTTVRVVEGDMLKLYKNFIMIYSATPKDEGSVMHWTLEYEKLSEDISEPYSMLELCVQVSKDMDAHLMSAAWLSSQDL